MKAELRGMLWGMAGVTVFGLTLPATRYVIPFLDPVFIGLGRASFAAGFALILLLITRQPLPQGRQWGELVLVALGVVVGFPVLSAWAMQTVPAAHGGVVLGILPLLTALFGTFWGHERPSGRFWFWAVLGSALVVAFVVWEQQEVGALSWAGDLALLLAVIVAAVGYAVGGRLSRQLGGWQVICWALVITLPFMLWPAWIMRPQDWGAVTGQAWLAFLYLALFSQLIGFFWWNKGLALGGVARVSQTQLLQPFVTLLAAAILLGESVGMGTVLFAILIVIVVAFGRRTPIATRSE